MQRHSPNIFSLIPTDVEGNYYNALLGKKIGTKYLVKMFMKTTGYTFRKSLVEVTKQVLQCVATYMVAGEYVMAGPGVGYKGKRYVNKNGKVYRYKYGGIRRRKIFEEIQFLQIHDRSISQS